MGELLQRIKENTAKVIVGKEHVKIGRASCRERVSDNV